MKPSFSLPDNAVHIWHTRAPAELGREVTAHFLPMLAPEEQRRYERFVQAKDRCLYLLGKVLVRTVLSHYLPSTPEGWVFTTNPFGKPVLANGEVQFNLSHTQGMVACVLARNFEVGIDVENVDRSANLDVARRYFAPAEVAYLEKVPEERRGATFFLFWTLKEAYVKARGIGLSLPLEQFAFQLHDLATPRIVFDPAMKEDADAWQFFLSDLGSGEHQAAVAVQGAKGKELDVEFYAFKSVVGQNE